MQFASGLIKLIRFIFLVVSTCSMAQRSSDSVALALTIDPIFKSFDRSNAPGCAVGVVKEGKLIFAKGYGIANLEYAVPITPSTVFDIASVSKQFTGLAISTLIEQGKIRLDDDIRTYIPEVPQFTKPITIRHLLHHTSGLRDWVEALHAAGWRWDEPFTFGDIIRLVYHQKDLDFEPGERYSYSNTGYNLLALLVEKVSGKPFDQWTEEFIFKPLHMRDSRFQTNSTGLIKNRAYSYAPGVSAFIKSPLGKIIGQNRGSLDSTGINAFIKSPSELSAYGSSSLFTTLTDLSKWAIHFNQQLGVNDPVYTRMLQADKLLNGQVVPYGYGLDLQQDQGLTLISHSGSWAGYRTILSHYPQQHLSIILLSNFSEFDVQRYSSAVASACLVKSGKPITSSPEELNQTPSIQLSPQLMRNYVGLYQIRPGLLVSFSEENGRLMVQANGEEKLLTEAKSDSTIWISARNALMIFVRDSTGTVSALRYRGQLAKRVIPRVADPASFASLVGHYYSPELGTEYTVDLVGGQLQMHHMRLGRFELAIDSTQADSFMSELGTVRFVKNAHQNVTGFLLSGVRINKIWFEKRTIR